MDGAYRHCAHRSERRMTGSLLMAVCLVVVAAVAAGCSLFQAKLVEPVETWEYACWQGFDAGQPAVGCRWSALREQCRPRRIGRGIPEGR